MSKSLRALSNAELEDNLAHVSTNVVYSANDYINELSRRDSLGEAKRASWTALASAVASVISAAVAILALLWSVTTSHPAQVVPSTSAPPPTSTPPTSATP